MRPRTRWWTPVLAAVVLAVAAAGCGHAQNPRGEVLLDDGWKFIRQDVTDAQTAGFDDGAWETVTLPHTWNALDGQDGGRNYYRGVGWYRRHFTPAASLAGKCLFLRFEGAATVTEAFVNGDSVGVHRGNFAAFCFDVTGKLKPGVDNVLAVKVNNARNGDIPPLGGDFNICGGLYRGVRLLALDPLSVTPLDDGGPGVYLRQTRVNEERAEVEVTVKLRNASDDAVTPALTVLVTDRDRKLVKRTDCGAQLAAGGAADVAQSLVIDKPHLWNGRPDPYLYTVTVEVRDGDRLADRVVQPLGLRYFRVDPNEGFLLNGKKYVLHGVNKHQDRLDKGWAISEADQREDIDLILEMGCTCVRFAHYQHPQYTYELCDRSGIVAWAELSLVGSLGKSPAFADNARQQLRELIKQNFNHPSIFFWSLFNELSFGRPKEPVDGPQDWDLMKELNKLAHDLDSTRLTTGASNLYSTHPLTYIPDIIGFNRYSGWYGGKPEDWPGVLDDLHKKNPNTCVGISEYGAGASIVQHEVPPLHPKTTGPWHPEEWQGVVHEAAYGAMRERPWLWGTFLWNMYDFGVDARSEGDHMGRNDKGMVTYDRKTRKDTFYWYQSLWRPEPLCTITSRRFSPRPAGATYIKVYTNCGSVEVRLNGKSLGSKAPVNNVVVFEDVTLPEGEVTVEAVGTKGQVSHTDRVVWQCTAPTKEAPKP
jgi:beta-galactosidase